MSTTIIHLCEACLTPIPEPDGHVPTDHDVWLCRACSEEEATTQEQVRLDLWLGDDSDPAP